MPLGWSKLKSPFASRKKDAAKAEKEAPHSDGMVAMASQVGNSGMAELLSSSSPPSQAVQPSGSEISQELDQAMKSRADSLIHGGSPQRVRPAPDGLNLDLDQPIASPVSSEARTRPASPNLSKFSLDLDEPVQHPTTAPASQGQAPAEEKDAQTPAEKGKETFGTFLSLREQLLQSEKGGVGLNSARFNAVDHSIDQVVTLMNQPLSGDSQEDQGTFNQLVSAYSHLLETCNVYTGRNARTSSGKARQHIVSQIKTQAEQDFAHLRDFSDRMSSLPPEQRPKTMVEALGMARTRVLTLKAGKESQLQHVGGAVSYLGVLEPGSLTDEKASGFFKPQDTLDFKLSDTEQYVQYVETMAKRKPEYQGIAAEAISLARETGPKLNMYTDERSGEKGSRLAQNFTQELQKFASSGGETKKHFKEVLHAHVAAALPERLPSARMRELNSQLSPELQLILPENMYEVLSPKSTLDLMEYFSEGGLDTFLPHLASEKKRYGNADNTVRVSDRNVATSRMANLLGIGDLVAQTERAELHDAEGGGVQQGNLMQKAPGKEVAAFFTERLRDEAIANADTSNANRITSFISPQAQKDLMESAITPEFMQSLTSLQVLDSIIGQCDRHYKNYFANVRDDGKLGKVQGIDNDFAFGFHSLRGQVDDSRLGNYGHKLVDFEGNIRLPHMDRKLADRILALRESDVRLMMADVLEDWAIDSLCQRITETQTAIRNDQQNNPDSGRYLDDVSQWDATVMEHLRGNPKSPTTYLGDLLAAGDSSVATSKLRGFGDLGVGSLLGELKTKELKQVWAGIAGAEDKAEYLSSHGVKDTAALEYAAAHGSEFTGSADELSSPDVSWILSGSTIHSDEIMKAFIAEQERIKRSRSQPS